MKKSREDLTLGCIPVFLGAKCEDFCLQVSESSYRQWLLSSKRVFLFLSSFYISLINNAWFLLNHL